MFLDYIFLEMYRNSLLEIKSKDSEIKFRLQAGVEN